MYCYDCTLLWNIKSSFLSALVQHIKLPFCSNVWNTNRYVRTVAQSLIVTTSFEKSQLDTDLKTDFKISTTQWQSHQRQLFCTTEAFHNSQITNILCRCFQETRLPGKNVIMNDSQWRRFLAFRHLRLGKILQNVSVYLWDFIVYNGASSNVTNIDVPTNFKSSSTGVIIIEPFLDRWHSLRRNNYANHNL
jgi:hypothetical protein